MAQRPEDWKVVRDVFEAALAQPAERRQSFVAESCRGEPAIHAQVAALLASHDHASGFLETPAARLLGQAGRADLAVSDAPEPAAGRTIGSYSIESCIGHGGMGAVYLARRADRAFERRVAIKMIRRGMGSDVVIHRFEHERQILASLDHPHIARLYDGGTTPDGLPYFVMEYVEGEPITDYCTRLRLGTKARLAMFRTVCGAVQYAHQNLVVHRDLKPANILVDASGQPRLLDFGIAKLLAGIDRSEPAGATLVSALTPDYASPEQVRGQTVTTATDVYSLGVILYELLAGRRPFAARTGSLEEIVRNVCETDPAPPSAASEAGKGARPSSRPPKELRGDLDTIVLKALRKEPDRRYASAQELSDDIGRHLEGKAVAARGDALAYRTAKFATRHWTAVLAAAVVLASLVVGVALIVRQSQIAEEQRRRAERRFADVRKIAGSFLFEVQDAIQYLPGATRARELVTTRALEYLDGLAAEAADDPTLQAELAHAYRRVGDVLGNAREANLGDGAGALASYRKALALQEALAARQPDDPALQRDLARTLLGVGDVHLMMRDFAAALASYRRSLAIVETLAAVPGDRDRLRVLGSGHSRIADALRQLGDPGGARASLERAIAILEGLTADATDLESRRLLARGYKRLGALHAERGSHGESLALQQRALDLNQALADADSLNVSLRNEVAMSHVEVGRAYLLAGRLAEALRSYRRAETITGAMAAGDPSNAQARWLHGLELNSIGFVLTAMRRQEEAVASHVKALPLLESVARADTANETYQYNVANTHQLIGDAHASAAAGAAFAAAKGDAWRRACAAYRRSGSLYDAMRRRGTLTFTVVADADHVAAGLARCERALR